MEELKDCSKSDPETGGKIDIVIGRLAEFE
jgi:hypothetical protein